MDLTNAQLRMLDQMIDETSDRLRHSPPLDLGWDADDVADFRSLSDAVRREIASRRV